MSIYLVITIDVEPDCTPSWQYSDPLTFRGVSTGIKERLQPLFIKYGVIPTYLINNVVLDDDESVHILSSLDGKFELGSHLHPEFIDPEKSFAKYAGKRGLANSCEYAPDIEFAKIESITRLFRDRFEHQPTSFRAGRFSAGANTITSLKKLGYKVDTSVTPNVLWNDKTHSVPVDFSQASEQPYFIKDGTILESDPYGSILQVPVSIVKRPARLASELKRTYFGLRGQIRTVKPVWLRPVYSSSEELKFVVNDLCDRYRSQQMIVLNMMFHNVEVMPGLSPYSKSESDCKAYIDQLEIFFQFCKSKGVKSIALTDLYDLQKKK